MPEKLPDYTKKSTVPVWHCNHPDHRPKAFFDKRDFLMHLKVHEQPQEATIEGT